jgi:hypothetical protein
MNRIGKIGIGILMCLIIAAATTALIMRHPTPVVSSLSDTHSVSRELMSESSGEWMEIHFRGLDGKDELTYIMYRNDDYGFRRYRADRSPESLMVYHENGQEHKHIQYASNGRDAISSEEHRADGSLQSEMSVDKDGYRTVATYWTDGHTVFSHARGKITYGEVKIDYFYPNGQQWVQYEGRNPVAGVNFPASGYYVKLWSPEGKLLIDGHHNDGTNTSTVIVNRQDGSRHYVQELHPESFTMLSLGDEYSFTRSLRSMTVYSDDGKRVVREVTILYNWQKIGTVIDYAEDGSRVEYNQFGGGKLQSIKTFDKDGKLVSETQEGLFPPVDESLLSPPVIGDPRVEWEHQEKLHSTSSK